MNTCLTQEGTVTQDQTFCQFKLLTLKHSFKTWPKLPWFQVYKWEVQGCLASSTTVCACQVLIAQRKKQARLHKYPHYWQLKMNMVSLSVSKMLRSPLTLRTGTPSSVYMTSSATSWLHISLSCFSASNRASMSSRGFSLGLSPS